MRVPAVAPFNSCIGCFRGDTTTGIALKGEAEWIVAAMALIGSMSEEEASGSVEAFYATQGLDRADVPDSVVTLPFRLCADCAERSKLAVKVCDFSGAVRCYEQ